MSQGRYERRRRRRTRRSFPWRAVALLAGLLIVLALLLWRCDPGEETPPGTEPSGSAGTHVTTDPTTDPTTEPTAEPTAEPTTEPTADPTTEPTTEPTSEPTTEPTTEPTEEPTTEPTTEPTEEPTEEPTTEPTEYVAPYSPAGDKAAGTAMSLVGTAYEFGASGPNTFDTTGLVFYCFRQNGVMAPRDMGSQASYGKAVPDDQLMPGDVLFFWSSTPGEVEYVGVYIGNNQFVAARNPEKPTSIMYLNSEYFSERFLFARRYYE